MEPVRVEPGICTSVTGTNFPEQDDANLFAETLFGRLLTVKEVNLKMNTFRLKFHLQNIRGISAFSRAGRYIVLYDFCSFYIVIIVVKIKISTMVPPTMLYFRTSLQGTNKIN